MPWSRPGRSAPRSCSADAHPCGLRRPRSADDLLPAPERPPLRRRRLWPRAYRRGPRAADPIGARRHPGDSRHMSEVIGVVSAINAVTGAPRVILSWGQDKGVLSPAEARDHALTVLQTADAAESDSFLTGFARERLQFDTGTVQQFLDDFRAFRAM